MSTITMRRADVDLDECIQAPTIRCVLASAELAATAIDFPWSRSDAREMLATTYLKIGDRARARDMIGRIEFPLHRAKATARLAVAEHHGGDPEAAAASFVVALQSASGIANAIQGGQAMAEVAQALGQAGDLESAMTAATGIADPGHRADALVKLAVEFAARGLAAEARAALQDAVDASLQVEIPAFREGRFASIAPAQAQAGFVDEALGTITMMGSGSPRIEAMAHVAEAQARRRQVEHAHSLLTDARAATTEALMDWSARARALTAIAATEAAMDDTDAARGTFAEAARAATRIPSESDRILNQIQIASAQADAGLHDLARNTLVQVQQATALVDAPRRSQLLVEIAKAQAAAGDLAAASVTASSIDEPEARIAASGWIAIAQATAGDLGKALMAARDIHDPWPRAQLLGLIATALAAASNAVP